MIHMPQTELLTQSISGFLLVALLTLSGCASLPNVEPPNPRTLDGGGQVRHFAGVTPQQILVAAEMILRKHQPEGRIILGKDTVVMEYKYKFFYGLLAGYDMERWVVVARNQGELTVASVAMGKATDGYVLGLETSGKEYPREGTSIDYGMFWKRLQSVLKGDPWPECEKTKIERNRIEHYEPLCM